MGLARARDAVVVGAGHNGLVCAASLARRGLDVLVLERRTVPGGAAATEEPWPGYRVSTASYVVSLMPPGLVSALGLRRFGYRVTVLEPDYYVPYPDGSALTLWGDPARTAQEIARFSRADADAYPRFDAYLSRLAHLVRELLFVIPPGFRLADLPRWAGVARRLSHWSRADLVAVARLLTASAADFLDEWFQDPRVKGALATQGIIGAWAGPMTPGTAYVLLHHWMGEVEGHEGAWGWVHGGMGALGWALAEAARASGAEVRTGAGVGRITVRHGRATGVELEDGTRVRARAVISNAHPVTTLLHLVGQEHLPPETVRDLRRFRSRSGSVKVNLALAELPRFRSWSGPAPGAPHTGILAISPSVEYLERAWDDAKHGRMSERPYIEAVFPTVFEPELAPSGRHIALLFTQFGPYRLAEGSWDTARETYLERVLSTLEEYAPDVAGAVLHAEVLAPPDLERRFGLVGGNIFHGEMTLDQLFVFRPVPGWGSYRTPVRGLYLCGAGTHPGGGVMGVPGWNCARVVWRDVGRGRLLGIRSRWPIVRPPGTRLA
ncbi:MAG TPA: NAD(P)/FAD-dependent oxidoreductase [Actinomycetota bacterium]|nr:NAD(P)/FAD-dependent oxidoreductase [Actinomycetota bacterium]